jgi:hypothetical protein
MIVFGVILLVSSVLGVISAFKRTTILLAVYALLALCLAAGCAYGVYYSFHRLSRVNRIVDGLSEKQLSELDIPRTTDELKQDLKGFYRRYVAITRSLTH